MIEVAKCAGVTVVFVPGFLLLDWFVSGDLVAALTSGSATPLALFLAGFAGAWLGSNIRTEE
ncbi:hypothetical protein [Marivita sp.]|uniref:hypothetical protein n=1 Tax=Marivita sp. TaxID=2003365 RepID=UPI003F6EE2A4